jgi:hypothetical protein
MVLFMAAGTHVPVIPVGEVVAKTGTGFPVQIAPIEASGATFVELYYVAVVLLTTHCPALAVKV